MSTIRVANSVVYACDLGRLCLFTLLCVAVLSGCKSTLDLSAFRLPGSNPDSSKDLADTSDVKGPIERVLYSREEKKEGLDFDLPYAKQGFDQAQTAFDEARQLQKAGELEKAGAKYERVVGLITKLKVRPGYSFDVLKLVKSRFVIGNEDHPYREDALFLLAESEFELNRLSDAQDHYDAILTNYASTRYMDVITKRMFHIAQTYLGFPTFAKTNEIMQVDFENPRKDQVNPEAPKHSDPTMKYPILPNFHDKSRPTFDTQGHAMRALKSIWLHDPTGPLADDAVMMEATYHLRDGNWQEAARKFQLLREQFPQSQHLETAFVLGGHVELMSYQGPSYDGRSLETARQLRESTIRLFPKSADRERIRTELKKIESAKAERLYDRVRFYQRKDRPKAVAVACRQVIEQFPMSEQAQKAREVLAKISPDVTASLPGFARVAPRTQPTAEPQPQPTREVRPQPVSPPRETPPRLRPVPAEASPLRSPPSRGTQPGSVTLDFN